MSKYYITVDTHTPGNRKETFINDSISRYAGMLVEGDDPVKVIREEVDNLIKIANEKFRSRIVNPSSHHKYQLIESIYIDFGNYSSTVRMHLVTSEADLSILEKDVTIVFDKTKLDKLDDSFDRIKQELLVPKELIKIDEEGGNE